MSQAVQTRRGIVSAHPKGDLINQDVNVDYFGF
jgi:hypothetical protein